MPRSGQRTLRFRTPVAGVTQPSAQLARQPRLVMELPGMISWDDTVWDIIVRDLGLHGLYATSKDVPPVSTEVELVINSGERLVRLKGLVSWVHERDGFGVRFDSLGVRERSALTELLKVAYRRRDATTLKRRIALR